MFDHVATISFFLNSQADTYQYIAISILKSQMVFVTIDELNAPYGFQPAAATILSTVFCVFQLRPFYQNPLSDKPWSLIGIDLLLESAALTLSHFLICVGWSCLNLYR